MRPRTARILPATRGGDLSPNAGRKVGDSKRIKSIAIEHLARLVDRDYFAASDLTVDELERVRPWRVTQ